MDQRAQAVGGFALGLFGLFLLFCFLALVAHDDGNLPFMFLWMTVGLLAVAAGIICALEIT